MRLLSPLSWISQSRGNSPVASAQVDGPPMMPLFVDVANGFNAHVAAHNERVYGCSKRKFGENSIKGNREITEFFSSSPMGAENSKIGGGERESKKRKLNAVDNYENEENASMGAKLAADSDKTPRKVASSRVHQPSYRSNSSNDKPQAKKVREDAPRNNREGPMLWPHDVDLEEAMMVDVEGLKLQRVMKKMMKMASVEAAQESLNEAETSERERKRELIKRRMQNEASASQNINIRGEDAQMHDIDGEISMNAVNDMRDLFQHQINLEIKLQHETLNELRCEIAKSQIALEQLRRCHLIPFPQTYADPEAMLNIMEGAGPSVPTTDGKMPKWASPYGVAEGAYTRHYAKWLIPDERFDGVVWEQQMMQGSGYPFPNMATVNGEIVRMDGRQTRNSFQLDPVAKNKRRSKGDVTAPLQALSSGYAQKKEDAGPSVLKRGDGQWVKLVCIDCQRENFGSTQGFINHCRIAHRREFKSHEEAAVNSGHVVEVDNLGGLVGEEKIPASVCYEGFVHHKIKQAPIDWTAAKSVLQHVNDALREFREGKLKGMDRVPGERRDEGLDVKEKPSKGFTPAAATPHLSALLAKTGFNKNLSSSVDAAKTPTPEDIAIASNTEDSDDETADTPVVAPASIKEFLNGTGKPTPRISFRPPILPSMRPSSSSSTTASGAASNQTHILPPPRRSLTVRPQSSSGKKAKGLDMTPQERAGLEAQAKAREVQSQGGNKSPKDMAQAKAREVQSRINEAAKNIKQARIAQLIAREEAEEVLVVGVGVLRGGGGGGRSDGDADSPIDLGMDDLSPTAHSEGDKAPSLVSDDDDYTAESHDESDEDGEEGEEKSEGEGIEVRDESDEARSRKRTQSREEESINVGRGNGKGQAKKGVTFASPVSSTKNKGRAMGKVRK